MQIEILDFVEGARNARGVTVVIDVFRAFSVACYAYARGAKRIVPMAGIEEALAMKKARPEIVAIGERHGRRVDGFDFGNSPTEISQADVRGKVLVHTTSAGTQGLTRASQADVVLTGSLVNAAAICAYIRALGQERVSIVRMGYDAKERCDEDDLCAELLHSRLSGSGKDYDTGTVRERLRSAPAAKKFFDPEATWAPETDFELCTDIDRFGFVLQLTNRTQGQPYLEKISV